MGDLRDDRAARRNEKITRMSSRNAILKETDHAEIFEKYRCFTSMLLVERESCLAVSIQTLYRAMLRNLRG